METAPDFWTSLNELVVRRRVIVDRPQGSQHPRYAAMVYPFDYGYLEGTQAGDGQGIDVWICESGSSTVTGVILTVDLQKDDLEAKLLLGCTRAQAEDILAIHNQGKQAGRLIMRDTI